MTSSFIAPAAKLFQHLPTLDAIKRGERPAPVNVEIDLSNRCSLGCEWCHFAYTHTRGPLAGKADRPEGAVGGGDLMDVNLASNILEQLSEAGVKSVTWTGGGEPTLHPHFDLITGLARTYGFDQGLYTHGGHLSVSAGNLNRAITRAQELKKFFTWVFISLDECTAETYQKSKGINRFEAALQGIRNLVAAEGKATIGIGFLLHRHNFHQVQQMVALGKELGVTYVQFRPTIHYEQTEPGRLAEDTAGISWAIGHLNAVKDDPFVIADIDRFKMYQNWNGHGYSTCYWSALQTVISPNGMVWRCTNKREHPSALLGDLSKESFADVWARSGGPCSVDGECRVMCRGHVANQPLQTIMAESVHANFI
jgi:cyclic pyranopterin phosphate synthase